MPGQHAGTQGAAEKVADRLAGHRSPVMMGQETEAARAYQCDPQALQEYAQAVYRSTDEYLDGLAPEDLDRATDMSSVGMPTMPLGTFLLTMLLGNNYAHTGEISTLKCRTDGQRAAAS